MEGDFSQAGVPVFLIPLVVKAIDPENVIFSHSDYGNLSDVQFTKLVGCKVDAVGIWGELNISVQFMGMFLCSNGSPNIITTMEYFERLVTALEWDYSNQVNFTKSVCFKKLNTNIMPLSEYHGIKCPVPLKKKVIFQKD